MKTIGILGHRRFGASEARWWVVAPGHTHDNRAPTLGSGNTIGARVITGVEAGGGVVGTVVACAIVVVFIMVVIVILESSSP